MDYDFGLCIFSLWMWISCFEFLIDWGYFEYCFIGVVDVYDDVVYLNFGCVNWWVFGVVYNSYIEIIWFDFCNCCGVEGVG